MRQVVKWDLQHVSRWSVGLGGVSSYGHKHCVVIVCVIVSDTRQPSIPSFSDLSVRVVNPAEEKIIYAPP